MVEATTATRSGLEGSTTADPVLETRRDGTVTLTLNRPARFNALSEDMLAALLAKLEALAIDSSLRCLVIAGAGKAFCAGHDLKEMRNHTGEAYFQDLFATCSRMMQAIRALPVPVIAQVHGVATAAGCQLVAACDLAIAAKSARFAVSGINVGLFCSTPAVALSRNIPMKAAFDMLATGRFITASEALTYGLVNRIVEDDALASAVEDYAAEIRTKSAEALRIGKQLFYAQSNMTLADAYCVAGDAMARNMMHADARNGIDGFGAQRR